MFMLQAEKQKTWQTSSMLEKQLFVSKLA